MNPSCGFAGIRALSVAREIFSRRIGCAGKRRRFINGAAGIGGVQESSLFAVNSRRHLKRAPHYSGKFPLQHDRAGDRLAVDLPSHREIAVPEHPALKQIRGRLHRHARSGGRVSPAAVGRFAGRVYLARGHRHQPVCTRGSPQVGSSAHDD